MSIHSVPVPKSYRDVNDFFTGILLDAPNFELLKKAATYSITLEMMINALQSGVDNVARGIVNPESLTLVLQCKTEVDAAHTLYKAGKISEAKREIQTANALFRKAYKRRTGKDFIPLLEDVLTPKA